jgi:uncharacterized membrane protein YtjA (UPF0391 family)
LAERGLLFACGFRLPDMEKQLRARQRRCEDMLHYALIFLVIALIAAVFGFGGIAAASAGIAKILFFLFLILFIVSLLVGRRAA